MHNVMGVQFFTSHFVGAVPSRHQIVGKFVPCGCGCIPYQGHDTIKVVVAFSLVLVMKLLFPTEETRNDGGLAGCPVMRWQGARWRRAQIRMQKDP